MENTTRTREQVKFDLSKMSARVDRVNVSGLLRTHSDYVMRAAEDLFKAKNFQDLMLQAMNARSYLNELGIFKDIHVYVDVSHGEKASSDGYEVTFKGTELSRIVGTVGTEVGQNEGSLRAEFTVPNLLGRGESISLQGAYSSTKENEITLKFWKPFFHTRLFRNRPEVSFSLFRHIDRKDISSFQNTSIGCIADFSLNTMLGIDLTHSIQYEASIREISLLAKTAPFVVREHCGPKLASLLRYSVIYDERDHLIFPTRGLMVKSINEYSGLGGNIAYVSSTTHAEFSVPLFAGIVAQLCGRVGIIKETSRTTSLPINNLFYCGGPLTIRGFKYGGAGPVMEGTTIGASTFWAGGLHLWAPMPFNKVFKGLTNNLRTHLFYNFGNYNNFKTENLRASAGLGLAIKLGDRARVELNYCVPLWKQLGDKLASGFQWGIGYEFV